MPNPSQTRRVKGLFRHSLDQLLLVDLVRYFVVAARYFWFTRIARRLQTLDAEGKVAINTVMHNLRGITDFAVNRSHLLVRPLSVIETIPVDGRILCIGPRSEGELLNLAAHGFCWQQITGLDLISYSPRVRLGDMHAMPFAEGSFEAVVLGWVLAYSDDPGVAAAEVVRVTSPGGVVAVGVEYSPWTQEEIVADVGYLPGAQHRISSSEEILGYFGAAVDHVYYTHVVAPQNRNEVGSLCVVFSIRK